MSQKYTLFFEEQCCKNIKDFQNILAICYWSEKRMQILLRWTKEVLLTPFLKIKFLAITRPNDVYKNVLGSLHYSLFIFKSLIL